MSTFGIYLFIDYVQDKKIEGIGDSLAQCMGHRPVMTLRQNEELFIVDEEHETLLWKWGIKEGMWKAIPGLPEQSRSIVLNADEVDIETGLYRHYKGGLYIVVGTGIHTETNEEIVVYYEQDDPARLFVRPATMWFEDVGPDAGKEISNEEKVSIPRFQLLREIRFGRIKPEDYT